jgi:hypothetical protein
MAITVDLTDEDGTFADVANSLSVVVTGPNLPPAPDAGGPYVIAEGGTLVLDASGSTDPEFQSLTYRWDVDGDGDYDEDVTGETPSLTWAQLVTMGINDGPDGPRTVTVEAFDGTDTATASTTLTVNNLAPTIVLNGVLSVNEGSVYTLNLSDLVDPGDDSVSGIMIDWGDGTTSTPGSLGDNTHTFADGNATVTITVTLTDEDGSYDFTKGLDVFNVAPTIALEGSASVDEGTEYTLTLGAVTDPGADTVSSYIVDWGDGSAAETFATGGAVTHTYADGVSSPTITVDLVDGDGTHVDADQSQSFR